MIAPDAKNDSEKNPGLGLSPGQIRLAIELYLRHAYDPLPAAVGRFVPPERFDPAAWLMTDVSERDPQDAPLAGVRSFALRMGNRAYPHMKLRLSRPPNAGGFLFTVDCHDAFLKAPSGGPDAEALEQLKALNARIAQSIRESWDAAGLPTETNYLQQKIRQARGER